MSLIEKALEKTRLMARQAAQTAPLEPKASIASTTRSAISPVVLAPRESAVPDLQITEELLQRIGVRAPEGLAHQQASEYRHMKRKLLAEIRSSETGRARLIMVASALSGEGKSYSAVNLALSLAHDPDFSTLLVDADVVKPNVSRQFGVEQRRGLTDAVTHDDLDPESLVLTTNIPGLSILPAGLPCHDATEYLGSARMADVFAKLLLPKNRIVVLDSLPMLLTTEARELAAHAGQVVFVVRAESTPKSAVLQSLELLGEDCNVKLVLNATEADKMSQYYGYSYNYNYTANK